MSARSLVVLDCLFRMHGLSSVQRVRFGKAHISSLRWQVVGYDLQLFWVFGAWLGPGGGVWLERPYGGAICLLACLLACLLGWWLVAGGPYCRARWLLACVHCLHDLIARLISVLACFAGWLAGWLAGLLACGLLD